MRQSKIDRAVAHATGESLQTIARRGFSIVKRGQLEFDDDYADLPPNIIDWDALDAERSRSAA